MPANTIPMDVSSLMPVRLLTVPMSRAMTIPAGTAAKNGLMPSRKATTIPGRTGVREGIAHECAPTGNDVCAKDRAHYADQHGDYEGAHH